MISDIVSPKNKARSYPFNLQTFFCLSAAAYVNDLYSFSPDTATWTMLSPSGSIPSPRSGMGVVSTPDGVIYVFGACTSSSG